MNKEPSNGDRLAFKGQDLGPKYDATKDYETITLYGGPKNGDQIAWAGGDEMQFQALPPPPKITDKAPRLIPRPEIATYRRSMNDRSVFVYQP